MPFPKANGWMKDEDRILIPELMRNQPAPNKKKLNLQFIPTKLTDFLNVKNFARTKFVRNLTHKVMKTDNFVCQISFEDIVSTHDTLMKSLGIELSDDDKRLPYLHWTSSCVNLQ